ncbi:MAG: methyl-accepting chemotaxis protein [Pseudomonadota bacterium]
MAKPAHSILKQLKYAFLGFGLTMGLVFPFYANIFVEWKPGMLGWFVAGCVVAGLSIGIFNHLLLEWLLIGKLRKVATAAERIRGGDLREGCGIRSADTVGEITRSFDDMAAGLRETLQEVTHSADAVAEASREIGTSMGDLGHSMGEFRKNEREITQVIDGMADASRTILELADSARQSAGSVDQLVRDGVSQVAATEQAISVLAQASQRISDNAARLDRSAQEVESAISAIRAIADQTNLLALNAAIEAARAGEQGRGFAVVADEVRKLSEQSAQATLRIDAVLKQVAEDVSSTVAISQENAAAVHTGLEAAHASSATFTHIEQATTTMKGSVDAVRDAADDQQMLVGLVLARIEENRGNTDATTQLTQGCVDRAQRMADTAQQLHQATRRFVL